MPELPDITVYLEALEARLLGARLESTRITHPFLLRTFDPPISVLQGRRVMACRRAALAYFVFDSGTLTLTEAGTKRRASLSVFSSGEQLAQIDPGGLEVLEASLAQFSARLLAENHTLKRSLTDPRAFSGIGNAYSDEILHRAHLSPVALTQKLPPEGIQRLYAAAHAVLGEWTQRLRAEAVKGFPENVTAFRPEMAVHGRFGKPCPVCGTAVQRIRYAENETNYCPRCQTQGRVLADRSLSRLLKDDWPRARRVRRAG